ncbi:hypothetical protein AVEN_71929-1 [Araneus ventricosus]|uniref:Uncharacterized protein n=1 Tax=Araneus ventricosus TaxID=182803 RepID=A0A4Y2F6L5_ARAVE|nr:hypothetical protein AVEN_71929-1 [Araneus ventricosus]
MEEEYRKLSVKVIKYFIRFTGIELVESTYLSYADINNEYGSKLVSRHEINGLIHHPWLNHDQRLKGNLHEQANADRNYQLDVYPNWRVGEKLVLLEG